MVAAANIGFPDVPFDCIVTPLVNASPDYLEWIQLQTMKRDPALAHYNINPEDEIHGLSNTIGEIGQVADKSHATSSIVPNASHLQVRSEETFAEGDDQDEDSTAEAEQMEQDTKEEQE